MHLEESKVNNNTTLHIVLLSENIRGHRAQLRHIGQPFSLWQYYAPSATSSKDKQLKIIHHSKNSDPHNGYSSLNRLPVLR